jgi:hypothetical protein
MKKKKSLSGRFAFLPNGQKVWIESVDSGLAVVRRVGGEWHRRKAVCSVSSLKFQGRSR